MESWGELENRLGPVIEAYLRENPDVPYADAVREAEGVGRIIVALLGDQTMQEPGLEVPAGSLGDGINKPLRVWSWGPIMGMPLEANVYLGNSGTWVTVVYRNMSEIDLADFVKTYYPGAEEIKNRILANTDVKDEYNVVVKLGKPVDPDELAVFWNVWASILATEPAVLDPEQGVIRFELGEPAHEKILEDIAEVLTAYLAFESDSKFSIEDVKPVAVDEAWEVTRKFEFALDGRDGLSIEAFRPGYDVYVLDDQVWTRIVVEGAVEITAPDPETLVKAVVTLLTLLSRPLEYGSGDVEEQIEQVWRRLDLIFGRVRAKQQQEVNA